MWNYKGYVLLSKSKKILKKSKQLKEKDSIAIKFYDKTIGVNIEKINIRIAKINKLLTIKPREKTTKTR